MFIEAGQEKNLLPETPARARNHVGDDFLVSVAEVRLAVQIIDGGRDVKALTHLNKFGSGPGHWQPLRHVGNVGA